MTNLDRLILRITNPTKLSLEDVFDTVKEYWDDVTKGYWEDTDEELAEELGVTPVALGELLEPTRRTYEYSNLGGNSSVRGYDHGEDWIVVMFSDGNRYLYTVKSTTPESITHMKELALAGKGLNSYIMRLQRMNYAGRNVRGEILIKPGMERYNPMGYQRLKLIEAFRNTMTHQASNEGFLDSAKKFFGMSNKDVDHNITKSHTFNHSGFSESIKRYFANTEWLNKQTFVTGDIDGSGISDLVGVGSKADIFKTIEANNKFEPIRAEWAKQLTDYQGKLKPIKQKYKDGPFDDATYEAMTAALDKLKPPKLPDNMLLKAWFTGEVNGPIKALTQEQVKGAADKMAQSLKNIWDKYDNTGNGREHFVDMSDTWINLANASNPSGSKIKSKYSVKQWADLAKRIDGRSIYWSSPEFKEYQTNYRNVFYACAKWIDRSIKGDAVVANETISNEGIFDSLKRLFGGGKPETDKSPAQPTPKQHVYIWDRATAIEKSPPKQLGSVSSDSPIFQLNGQYNPNWIARLGNDLKQYTRITKEIYTEDAKVAAWANKWEPQLDEFIGGNDRPDEFLQVAKAWQASQPQPWFNKFRNSHDFIGWGKDQWNATDYPGFGYTPWKQGVSVEIPEQNAQATMKIVRMVTELGKIILDSLEEDLTWVSYDFTDAPFRGYAYESNGIDTVLNNMHYHADSANSPRDHYNVVEERLETILKGLVDYVESAASNGTGMEAYKQKTLKRYRDQILSAGHDGLDPTARKLMSVGLESIGMTPQIAMEAIGQEEIDDPTRKLFVSVESMITQVNTTISNESLWGAIKYVFGGNYEDLPKINAAYSEAIDAVKSTYGNPEWIKKRRLQTGHQVHIKNFLNVAKDPAGTLAKVKQNNQKSLEANRKIIKEELEYLGKYTKFLGSSERNDSDKAQSLLDMFDPHFSKDFDEAAKMNFGMAGKVNSLDGPGIVKAAATFEEAMKYRMETDLLATSGFKKLMYTDGGRERWGDEGTETAKLDGPARDLAEQVGERFYSIQEDYYNATGQGWLNADCVVKGCLMVMEASAD